jgi:4-amino-4-deoxy-L-arabinose transferase-like glycosyltransferase
VLFVLAVASLTRFGYLYACTDGAHAPPSLEVQGAGPRFEPPASPDLPRPEPRLLRDDLVRSLSAEGAFRGLAPLSAAEEPTAQVAPGHYWLLAQYQMLGVEADAAVRWSHAGLGVLTALCLYFFTRRAFFNSLAALLAGLLAALHPFWIINAAELSDGAVVTFLFAAALALGTRGAQSGGALTSLLFGLCLAALALTRAALLPLAVVALLWFLYQCRGVRSGWFNAVLAFLGFANGLAPWAVRNYNQYQELVPVVNSAYLHLWIGNNPKADGGPMDEAALRATFAPERLEALLHEENQTRRYHSLGHDVLDEISRDPSAAAARRWSAGLKFLVGDEWFKAGRMSRTAAAGAASAPAWLADNVEALLQGFLLVLVLLALLGWRFSHAWKGQARLATLALVWTPLPYLLSHAEELSGPRLPWDACLICFAAYALACLSPLTARSGEGDEPA